MMKIRIATATTGPHRSVESTISHVEGPIKSNYYDLLPTKRQGSEATDFAREIGQRSCPQTRGKHVKLKSSQTQEGEP